MAPVTLGVHVAQVEAGGQAQQDARQSARDLAGHEGLAAYRGLVVEEDAVAGIHAVGFAVIDRDPVGIELGAGIGRTGIEGRFLRLRDLLHLAEQLRSGGLIEAGLFFQAQHADGFQKTEGPQSIHIGGVFGRFEGDLHMALGCQVVDFVRLHLLHDADQVAGIRKIPVVQYEFAAFLVRPLVKMVDTVRIEQGRAALDAVDFIALVQKEFRQIGAVLASDTGDECFFHDRKKLIGGNGCYAMMRI